MDITVNVNDSLLCPLHMKEETCLFPYVSYECFNIHIHEINDWQTENIKICTPCYSDLFEKKVPIYSIPNSFFPERAPEVITKLSIAETLLISKVFHRSIVWESQYSHSRLNHHVVCFDATYNR